MVLKSIGWRIRDGSKVRIWDDNWIPNNPGFKTFSAIRWVDRDARVFDLIGHDLCRWSKDLMERCFDLAEVRQIISIPLPLSMDEDSLIWHSESNEVYFMRSAYRLIILSRDVRIIGSSN
ncbi:unnamed protein product [Lathyrus oleraceus]